MTHRDKTFRNKNHSELWTFGILSCPWPCQIRTSVTSMFVKTSKGLQMLFWNQCLCLFDVCGCVCGGVCGCVWGCVCVCFTLSRTIDSLTKLFLALETIYMPRPGHGGISKFFKQHHLSLHVIGISIWITFVFKLMISIIQTAYRF